MRALSLASLPCALACFVAACPAVDVTPADLDAGLVIDAGANVDTNVDANVDAGTATIDAAALVPDALAFRFVRMRTPTAGGDEIVRIGLDERVRSVDGVIETRAAPSPASLAALVALCASRDVERALRKAGDTAPSMTIIELGCAPVSGIVACEPGAGEAGCPSAFAPLRDAVTASWRGDGEESAPASGLTVRTTRWQGARATTASSNEDGATTLTVAGKSLLPAKGERPWERAPDGKRAVLCSNLVCVDVTAPALVHLDLVEQAPTPGRFDGVNQRFRCASCTPAPGPRSATVVPGIADVDPDSRTDLERLSNLFDTNTPRELSKADVLRVFKDANDSIRKECARAKGPKAVRVSLAIQPNGTVAVASDATAEASARGKCTVSAVRRLRFPRSSTTTPVTIPISFGK